MRNSNGNNKCRHALGTMEYYPVFAKLVFTVTDLS